VPNLPHRRRRIDKVMKIATFDVNGLPGDVSDELEMPCGRSG
jgi:hypothetical protein